MKVAVSYIKSNYDLQETIAKINDSNADFIHADIMDGKYVKRKNTFHLKNTLKMIDKPLEVHLMVKNPLKYLKYLKGLNIRIVYIHYSSYFLYDLEQILKAGYRVGLVINPDEDINIIQKYFAYVDKVLVMSVKPGMGGQEFIPDTLKRIKLINKYRLDNNLVFSICVDGGINDLTIKSIRRYIDEVVSGSFVCMSDNYNEQIDKLRK